MATTPAKRPQGPVQRFKGAVVEAGRSFFPSMGWREWRSTIRGEAAPRPNPRMRVHNNSFWYHIRPRALPLEATAWYYTFGLGWLSAFFFVLEAVTGLVLMVYYTPAPDQAYANMLKIISDVPLGRLMRNMHRLGAHMMVAIVVLHMMRTYFTASYKAPRQFIWFTGVILLAVTLFLSFSGYLLPWDQLAYWAVTIGSSMADAAPFLGNATNLLLRGAPDVGAGTLLRFYLLHIFMLPMIAVVLISVHYYAVRKQEISPIHELFENRPPTKRKIPFLPDQVFFELAVIALLTFAFIIINQYFWDAKLESHANPTQTPNHTKAPWYFLWLQGMLKLGDKQWFGIAWPPLIVVGLLLLPYLDRNPSRRFKDRKIAITSAILGLLAFGFLTNAGLPTYGIQQTAGSELTTEYVPIEGEGVVDGVSWTKLPDIRTVFEVSIPSPGAAPQTRLSGQQNVSPETQHLYDQFTADVVRWSKTDRRFIAPLVADLTIEPWIYATNDQGQIIQDHGKPAVQIKRATVNLTWTASEVDKFGNPTPLRNKQGQYETSRLQQSRYLDRDSHDSPLPVTTSDQQQASK
ncbi:MAG TPA: cytochrome bc complex cytochrome b subunit [Herpetosiphonaceae bacterium]|nr:cytochrome bc complex cytochrome b subunit [Herpetosiphonaceae bacterium]